MSPHVQVQSAGSAGMSSGSAYDDDEGDEGDDGGWAAPVTGIARAGSAMLGLS